MGGVLLFNDGGFNKTNVFLDAVYFYLNLANTGFQDSGAIFQRSYTMVCTFQFRQG